MQRPGEGTGTGGGSPALLPFPERELRRAVAASRARAVRRWRRLRRLPSEEQGRLVERFRAYHSWGLAELLCRESIRQANRDPAEACRLSHLACVIATELFNDPPPWASLAQVIQLSCVTFAHLSNAHRVADEMPRARELLEGVLEAWEVVADDPDPLGYGPRILELAASLCRAQRMLPESLAALDKVIAHYRSRDPHRAGRAMVIRAKTLNELGRPATALAQLEEAETFLDIQREPSLARTLTHNRTLYLVNLGRYEEASPMLASVREAFSSDPGSLDALRLDWIEARIEAGLGMYRRARRLLDGVRQAFSSAGLHYDAALAAVELASLAAEAGDTREVRRLARSVIPIFEQRSIHREGLAALRLFRYAALEDWADPAFLGALLRFFRRSRHDRRLQAADLPVPRRWKVARDAAPPDLARDQPRD